MRTLFLFVFSLISVSGALWPSSAFALDDYVLLAPLPGIESSADINASSDPVASYFTAIYQIAISAVLVIAVVMFIIGGIQYMTSDSIAGKGGGRDTIAKALIGILLATGSYLLLFIIGGEGSVRVGFNMPKLEFVGPVDSQEGEGPVVPPDELVNPPPPPVATAAVKPPDSVAMVLTSAGQHGETALSYLVAWAGGAELPTNLESATVRVEFFQEAAGGSGVFNNRIEVLTLGSIETNATEPSSFTVPSHLSTSSVPTIAKLQLHDSSGVLIGEFLYGFNGIPVDNP